MHHQWWVLAHPRRGWMWVDGGACVLPWAPEATNLDLVSHIRALQTPNVTRGSSYPSSVWALTSIAGCVSPCLQALFRRVALRYGWLPARPSMPGCMQPNRDGIMKATTETANVLTWQLRTRLHDGCASHAHRMIRW